MFSLVGMKKYNNWPSECASFIFEQVIHLPCKVITSTTLTYTLM